MTLFYVLAAIKAVFLGAIYGRLDGGGITQTNEWIERSLIMFFFVLACATFSGYWALFAYAGVIGIATGHGQYFMDRLLRGQMSTKEKVDPFVSLFFGEDWRTKYGRNYDFNDDETEQYMTHYYKKLYWRNAFGMFVTGSLVGLPAVVLSLAFGQYVPAGLFAMTGVVKALSYIFCYEIFDKEDMIANSEYLNGGLRTALCIIVVFATQF